MLEPRAIRRALQRCFVPTGAALALAFSAAAAPAHALIVAQVTQHGYILIDEPNAAYPYDGSAGASGVVSFGAFVADAMTTLDAFGAPHGDFVAVMQQEYEPAVAAFYARMRNETRGIGDRNPQGGNSEVYDLNPLFGNPWSIDGALFLNTPDFYIGGNSDYGSHVICPQEFGHRFLAEIHVPSVPGMPMGTDAGVDDGGMDAAVATADAGPQPVDILLGRDRVHWSYFVNSGGSPMEGNAWEETSPGVFTTQPATFLFSPLDLYLMGLAPATAVPPFWFIANPNVMGQTDQNGQVINRASPPEAFGFGRVITIQGTRVTYTIDDVIRANGPRNPAYEDPDAGTAPDAGNNVSVREMRTTWVLLTTSRLLTSRTAGQFDRAIESCAGGYAMAASDLAHVVPMVTPVPDAGHDAAVDAMADGTAGDASDGSADGSTRPPMSGCACRAGTSSRAAPATVASLFAFATALSLRKRRTRARVRKSAP